MAMEYRLSYTAAEIDEKLGKTDDLVQDVNQIKDDISDVNNNTEKPVAAGKVWTSTANGAGWADPRGGSGIDVTGSTVGQTVKIASVDDNGVPTAWEPADFPDKNELVNAVLSALPAAEGVSY